MSTIPRGSASGPSMLGSPPTKVGPSCVQQEGASTPHPSSTKFWTTGEALPLPSSACPGSQNEDTGCRDREDRHPPCIHSGSLRGLEPEIESVLSQKTHVKKSRPPGRRRRRPCPWKQGTRASFRHLPPSAVSCSPWDLNAPEQGQVSELWNLCHRRPDRRCRGAGSTRPPG